LKKATIEYLKQEDIECNCTCSECDYDLGDYQNLVEKVDEVESKLNALIQRLQSLGTLADELNGDDY
jgi:hypothetical protein